MVLTFFNAPCNDICPVLAAEIEQADADLGAAAADVEFVTVNTDPAALAQSAEAPAVSGTGLGALPNWHMVTGPLASLNPIWKAYGVSISVSTPRPVSRRTTTSWTSSTRGVTCATGPRRSPTRARPGRSACRGERWRVGLRASPPTPERLVGPVTRPTAAAARRRQKAPIWQRHRGLVIAAAVARHSS